MAEEVNELICSEHVEKVMFHTIDSDLDYSHFRDAFRRNENEEETQ